MLHEKFLMTVYDTYTSTFFKAVEIPTFIVTYNVKFQDLIKHSVCRTWPLPRNSTETPCPPLTPSPVAWTHCRAARATGKATAPATSWTMTAAPANAAPFGRSIAVPRCWASTASRILATPASWTASSSASPTPGGCWSTSGKTPISGTSTPPFRAWRVPWLKVSGLVMVQD